MSDMFWTIFGLALALCAAPGPINLESLRRGVQHGFWPALSVQLGALAVDLLWAMVVVVGAAPLVRQPVTQVSLTVLGTLVLLWTAAQELRAALAPVSSAPPAASARTAALAGAVYAASSPLTVLVWLAVAALVAGQGSAAARPEYGAVIAGAYVLGALVWSIPVALGAAWGRRVLRPGMWRWWHTASGLALGGYGLTLAWSLV